jgi:hypothetical protein
LSTVFTYQHHVIDILGGAALGLACYYLIPERKIAQPATTNPRIGVEYAMGATILAAAGLGLRPWGLALWWPALSMAIVAGAYFGLYAGITQKNGGRISGVARIVLAPWLAAQRASLIYYRGHAAPWQVLSERVWIGRQLGEREAAAAVRLGVTAAVDLTGEFSEARAFLAVPYLNLPILDLTAPTPDQIRAAIDFINAHRDQGAVYVHCKIGYSRSATVLGAWLIDRGLAAAAEEAVAQIRTVRPSLVVRPEALAALRSFQQGNGNVSASAAPLIEARA